MSKLKPGEFRLTEKAMERWNLPRGAEVLDIGCGRGDTVEYLVERYGFSASGIDLSDDLIKEGLERNSQLSIKKGDGEFLEEYPSYRFHGVLMECVLSVTDKPDEVLHETYCVLKKGGKLFLSDLYVKDPGTALLFETKKEAEEKAKTPHDHGECSISCEMEHQKRAVNFRTKGRFLMEPLLDELKEIGFRNLYWEDCSLELDNYVAQKLMTDGTLKGCLCDDALIPMEEKTGYFLLTAEKPL